MLKDITKYKYMDNPKVFNEFFNKYGELFCYRRVELEVEKECGDEIEDEDFDIDSIMEEPKWRGKVHQIKFNLKSGRSKKVRKEFEEYVIKRDKSYLDPFATIPSNHKVNGYDFRDFIQLLEYFPPISKSGDALRIQSKISTQNKKHRDEETLKYLKYCQDNIDNLNRPFNIEDVPDVYSFYVAEDDCFRLMKKGGYHKDFSELKRISKIKTKEHIEEGKKEDLKEKMERLKKQMKLNSISDNNAEENDGGTIE